MLLVSLLSSGSLYAQSDARSGGGDSLYFKGTILVERKDARAFVTRHDRDMERFFEANKADRSKPLDVLFLGSSTINMWNTIEEDMAPLKVIRRSYGGSAIRDNIYNYDIVARGFHPKAIVLYTENDYMGGATDTSVLETIDLFRIFIEKLRTEYVGIPVYLVGYKPSPARATLLPKQIRTNELFEDYAAITPGVYYVDIPSLMYTAPDKAGNAEAIRPDIWGPDKLHMNAKGYEIWTNALKPLLLKASGL